MTEQKLINEFSNTVNNFNFNEDEFLNAFKRQHRTLQQSMFKAMLKVVEMVADDSYRHDGRNIASHQTAKKLVKGWRNEMSNELVASGDAYWTKETADNYAFNENRQPSNLPLI